MKDAFINCFSDFLLVCNLFYTMACCDICGAVFTFNHNMLRHMVMTHSESDEAPIQQCDKCEYKGTYTNLMRHKLNKHRENKIKCSLCPSEFYTKSNLNRHMDTSHKK